jgi:hypothetical protein
MIGGLFVPPVTGVVAPIGVSNGLLGAVTIPLIFGG